MLSQRRIARTLAALLVITLFQTVFGIQAPYSHAAAGSVGPSTASGTCASSVGETTYVTATFVSNAFCLLQFSTGTTWTVPIGVNSIDILVVGGGGGGGSDGGGGGGGGEVRTATGIAVSGNLSITTTVGTGGVGNIHGQTNATNGNTSSVVIGGTTYSAGGGLKSVNWQAAAYYAPGGSGGTNGTQLTGATDFSKGGRNSVQNDGYAAGGYGTVGYAGVTTSFTGTSTVFAGGGGGGICTNTKSEATFGGLAGGAGGGGRGALHTQNVGSDAGQPGTNGLGGGGGGGSACNDGLNDGVTSRTAGGRGGDGVVYIKYVPVPTITTNPINTTTVLGNTTTFTAANQGTISGATRTVKWQVLVPNGSWADISGATSDTYVTAAATRTMHGNQYRYVITDTYGTVSSTSYSTAATLTVIPPVQGDTDSALSKDASGYNYGYLLPSGAEAVKALSGDSYTFESWVRPTNVCSGTYCAIGGREGDWLLAFSNSELTFITYNVNTWGAWQSTGTNIPLNQWSHVALTKNGTTWTLYVNGAKTYSATLSYSPLASSGYYFYVGERWGGGYTFNGSIDEVKLWRSDRSSSISTDMNSTATNTTGLIAYWNFNEGSGLTAYNQVPGAAEGSDFTLPVNDMWDANVVSTQTTSGAYTVRTFYRSYFNLNGGWKSPVGINKLSVLLVAGGGGGGGGLNGGGGGGGGFIETSTAVSASTYYQIRVGNGGVGAISGTYAATAPTNGADSTAFSFTAVGGGRGSAEFNSPYAHYAAAIGGSGGGGSWGNNSANYTGRAGTTGQGSSGGNSGSLSGAYAGAGGGGASTAANGVGSDATSSSGGAGGAGRLSIITGTVLAGGGGGSLRNSSNGAGTGGSGGTGGGGAGSSSGSAIANATNGAQSGAANTGGGGGAGVFQGAATDGKGAQGGTGIVVVRWITALKPTFTAPTTAYLNVGMTETFTTNVAQDSATVSLTRTFRWESSTTGSGGTFSLIKQGTGAANAYFSWLPQDTATTGSNFVYRVIVSDTDTLGLSIVDTSTAVWAVINRALVVSGNSTIIKPINVARNETFTVTYGTVTYSPTLSPVIAGITLDTSTAGSPVIKISDTASVGTYYETLTVVDSVSATIVTPLTIIIAAPPTLLNSADIVTNDLVFNLDAGNSQSLLTTNGAATSGLSWNDISGRKANATTGPSVVTGAYGGSSCTAPTYSTDGGGSVVFTGNSENCYYTTYTGTETQKSYTFEAWFKTSAALSAWSAIMSQSYPTTGQNISVTIGALNTTSLFVAFWDGGTWRYANCGYTPTIGVWTHIAGTYDGTTMYTYINGSNTVNGSACSAPFTGGFGSTPNVNGIIIGKGHPGNSAAAFPGSIASIRIYKRALTAAQILANYNATKDRFITSGGLNTSFTQKYGAMQAESFTVTSGYGSRNVTFTVGDRTGIDWDTTTVINQVKLSIQDSLTVGTYLDTATVTDSLGQSTYLPININISKADTITVTIRNPKTSVYTGLPAASLPDIAITGLVSSDTGTATRLYSAPASINGAPETYTALVNSAVVPTDVETYTVSSAALTSLTRGSLSNYQGVIYETSTLTITQAKQPYLTVNYFGAIAGSSFTLYSGGGAGGGAITETVTAGGSGTNCSITGHVLSNTSGAAATSTCNILITKAVSRNYKVETLTATIYFLAFANNQQTQTGAGSAIGINGMNTVSLDTTNAPTITGLSTYTLSLATNSGTFTITGAGFGLVPITVKFWRNKSLTVTSSDGSTLSIPIASITALTPTSGKVMVITANGIAVSIDSLTITP